jgi:hypothetical protein
MLDNYNEHVKPFIDEMGVPGTRLANNFCNAIRVLKRQKEVVTTEDVLKEIPLGQVTFDYTKNEELAHKVAAYYLWWESLGTEKKDRIKKERDSFFRQRYYEMK